MTAGICCAMSKIVANAYVRCESLEHALPAVSFVARLFGLRSAKYLPVLLDILLSEGM